MGGKADFSIYGFPNEPGENVTTSTGATSTHGVRVFFNLRRGQFIEFLIDDKKVIGPSTLYHASDWLPLRNPVAIDTVNRSSLLMNTGNITIYRYSGNTKGKNCPSIGTINIGALEHTLRRAL